MAPVTGCSAMPTELRRPQPTTRPAVLKLRGPSAVVSDRLKARSWEMPVVMSDARRSRFSPLPREMSSISGCLRESRRVRVTWSKLPMLTMRVRWSVRVPAAAS